MLSWIVVFALLGLAVALFYRKVNADSPEDVERHAVNDLSLLKASEPRDRSPTSTNVSDPSNLRSSLSKFPSRIAFLDVETTGLHSRDRIVSLAIALMKLDEVHDGNINISFIHRIYNPGIKCNPVAEQIHGHDDWTLRQQPFFVEDAHEIHEFVHRSGLVCSHNAQFDLGFLNREFESAALPSISVPSYCTMLAYRQRYSGSASLKNLSAQLGLARKTERHGALEDVFLTMNVFLRLNGVQLRVEYQESNEAGLGFQNFRAVPPRPLGDLPPRRRRPNTPKST